MFQNAKTSVIGLAALVAVVPACANATDLIVTPDARPLQHILDSSSPGDVIKLKAGQYAGPLTIRTSVRLEGEKGAAIVGNGRGSVVTISAEGASVSGLEISGSGTDLAAMDSGVFVEQSAANAIVENNVIHDNLSGIYLHGATNSLARNNRITGLKNGRVSEAGNGVTLWNAPGAKVLDNDISFGRDGIATNSSKRNVFSGNYLHDVRFAIHYMYTNDSEISGNTSTGNSVGYAIMFSSRLKITRNLSDGDRDHGLLLNYANNSEVSDNIVHGRMLPATRWAKGGNRTQEHTVPEAEDAAAAEGDDFRPAPEKCVFIYNANKNRVRQNVFEGCAIGIHFTAGSEGNKMSGNAFINNRTQVKYVGTRYLDWSQDGMGNYWSDNPSFDLDGDGIADRPYRPNDLIDKVLWTTPQAKVLTSSPAVQVIRWAQTQFPALLPGGVIDSHPLMAPTASGVTQQ